MRDQQRFDRATALRDSGHLEEAAQEYQAMAAETGDVNGKSALLLNVVNCYAKLKRLDGVRDLLAKIEQLAPNDPDVCINVDFVVACATSQEGHKEEAVRRFEDILKNYRKLLKTDPYFRGSIERRRAFCVASLGRYREAISVLNSASARAMSSADEQQEIHLWLGICLTELDERETAKQEFLHAIDLGLKNEREADARYRLSGLYYSDGALAEAKSQLESILRHRSESTSYLPRAYIYRRLSKVYHFMGDEENSRRYKKLEEDCSYVIH